MIAAYYFPNYHPDKRNAIVHGKNWTEWELVKHAKPRFPGHIQPRVPLWGYEDEADPEVMAKKITAAEKYGLDAFIFDWYFYEDGLFLERALEEGFMPAAMDRKLKFAIMWANHDWTDIHPWKCGTPKKLLYPGSLSDAAFERMTDYVIKKYFTHPAYWKIDGKPYFSIYNQKTLGGTDRLKRFREKVKAAGFPDLHLNLILQEVAILPGETGSNQEEAMIDNGFFDSITSYIWLHHCELDSFPRTSYRKKMEEYFKIYEKSLIRYHVPSYPNVTVGWDSSPRTVQSTPFDFYGYPYTPVMESTAEEFHEAIQKAKSYNADIITINAWNEWTEGSYLEPDNCNKFKYLEALL